MNEVMLLFYLCFGLAILDVLIGFITNITILSIFGISLYLGLGLGIIIGVNSI